MTPTYITVDGIEREITSWPVVVDGITRRLSSKLAVVDGVQREIFGEYPDVTVKVKKNLYIVPLTQSNIPDFLTIQNSSYYFEWNGTEYSSNNTGKKSTTAKTVITAKQDCFLYFSWGVSSESKYDELTIAISGSSSSDTASGEDSGYRGVRVSAGGTITFTYKKDSSGDDGEDRAWFRLERIQRDVPLGVEYGEEAIGKFKPMGVGQWLTSTGTQYIDTGVKGNNNTAMEVKFRSTQNTVCACGADKVWCTDDFMIETLVIGFGTAYIDAALQDGDWHTVRLDKGTPTVDGAARTAMTAAAFETPYNLHMFALNRNGAVIEHMMGDIAYCKIWQDGVLVRDFVPYQDGQYVGMYDRIESVLYTSLGDGTFQIS